jgi:hypothetical protein
MQQDMRSALERILMAFSGGGSMQRIYVQPTTVAPAPRELAARQGES